MKKRGEVVSSLKTILERYKNKFKPPQKTVIDSFIKSVREVLGVSLTPQQVSFNPTTNTITLTTNAVIKEEIRIHHAEILKKMKETLGEQNTPQTIL